MIQFALCLALLASLSAAQRVEPVPYFPANAPNPIVVGTVGRLSNVQLNVVDASITGVYNLNKRMLSYNLWNLVYDITIPNLKISANLASASFGATVSGAGVMNLSFRNSVVRIASTLNYSGNNVDPPNKITIFRAGAATVSFDGFANNADKVQFEREFAAGLPRWLSANLAAVTVLMQDAVDQDSIR